MPIPDNLKKLELLVDNQEQKVEKLNSQIKKPHRLFQRKFGILKLSTKLQNWHTLTFAAFVKELKKKKIKLGLSEEVEWEEYFEQEKAKAIILRQSIDQTDKAIDEIVYALYGLTDAEIAIVEENI